MTALMTFTSHIDGKNAAVTIHDTHIEWVREGRFGIGKAGLAAVTLGASLATKSGRSGNKGAGSDVIPMKSVTSVTTQKDGMRNSIVRIITSGNTIDMRVSHGEAEQIKATVLGLILA